MSRMINGGMMVDPHRFLTTPVFNCQSGHDGARHPGDREIGRVNVPGRPSPSDRKGVIPMMPIARGPCIQGLRCA
jgi:hypothetical protein